jgi:hypothetical protein
MIILLTGLNEKMTVRQFRKYLETVNVFKLPTNVPIMNSVYKEYLRREKKAKVDILNAFIKITTTPNMDGE